jgi:uncharacterized protein YqeY
MLREKLIGTELIKEAMKSQDKMKLQVVKNLKSEIIRKEGGREEMTDAQIINMIKKSIDSLNDNIKLLEANGNTDAVTEAQEEIAVLESFMPQMMSETEIDMAVTEIINETGASSMKDKGRVMGMFAKQYAGKADNGIASKIIDSKLQ